MPRVIAEERERLDRALAAISALDEEQLLHALRVSSGVLYVVLHRMENRKPTQEELAETASEVAAAEAWIPLDQGDVLTILDAHVDVKDLGQLRPAEKAASLLFVVTGALVGGCAPTDRRWEDYLDECENMLDSMYGQGPLAQS